MPYTWIGQYYIVYAIDNENNNEIIIKSFFPNFQLIIYFMIIIIIITLSIVYLNCAEKNESAHNVYSYCKVNDPYTCYPSCEVTGSYKNEREEYHCSKELNYTSYYYTLNIVKICLNEESLKTCTILGNIYLRRKEYVCNCESIEF